MIRTVKPQWKEIGEKGVFEVGDFISFTDNRPPFQMVIKVRTKKFNDFEGEIVYKKGAAMKLYHRKSYSGWALHWSKAELSK